MQETIEEESISDFYTTTKLMPRKMIEKMSASHIVYWIDKFAKDKRKHVLWEDCARWLDYKMRVIKQLVSYLESKKP